MTSSDENFSLVVDKRDVHTGKVHRFLVDTDNYGVRITHQDTEHSVVLEIFDGKLQVLVFPKDAEEPANIFPFT